MTHTFYGGQKMIHLLKSTSKVLQLQSRDCSSVAKQARVVIAGAGVVGNSVAYHLTQNGWRDIIVLDQNQIGSGTSHFGSGTIGLFKPIAERNIVMESLKLYKHLESMGHNLELKKCGSINLAQSKDRKIALKRRMAYTLPTGLYCELIDRDMIKKLHPYLHTDDLEGGVYVPDDCVANPSLVCNTLAELAAKAGAKYYENCHVKYILTKNDRVEGVECELGVIKCEYFINCAGMWSRELGLKCNKPVRIPTYPAEHFYGVTTNLDLSDDDLLPCIRDYDSHLYSRHLNNNIMIGWFEQEAKPAFGNNQDVPRDWKKQLKHDYEHFKPLWEKAVDRLPILKKCSQPDITNSPDNFTPDGRWILGETAEVENYFVACGMNGNSLQGSGGIGKIIAEWVIQGRPTQEISSFNVQRFLDLHNNRQYLQQRIREVVGRHYAILYPNQSEYKFSRKLRCSPLYSVLETRGAIFGIKMAYERALYFDTTYQRGDPLPKMPSGSFYKPKFFDFMRKEYAACVEGVGIIDISSFSKIEIKPGVDNSEQNSVLAYLQMMCSNDVNIDLGGIVHTGMQNDLGGYENDCMLIRQSNDSYFMISPSSQQTRIYEWMSRNLPTDSSVTLNDVTSMYTVINVVGPKSTLLMRELSNSDVRLAPFSYKKVNIGYASDVMIMSFTHTGEPGYCLYVPSEYALHVYDRLMTVGLDYGVRDVGTLTQRFMRIDKFIPFWADELTSFTTPYEAGMGYFVRLDKKEDFIGKTALMAQKRKGVTKRLVMFLLGDMDADKDVWPWGGEPLYRNGEFCGTVTSAGYGFSTNKLICLGFISRPDSGIISNDYIMDKNAVYHVDIAGKMFKLTQHIHPSTVQTLNNRNLEKKMTNTYKPTVVSYKKQYQ